MAKVSTRTPPLISLYFCQERGDPDYGSCLWNAPYRLPSRYSKQRNASSRSVAGNQGFDTSMQGLRCGNGYSLEELDYGNDCTDELCKSMENGFGLTNERSV